MTDSTADVNLGALRRKVRADQHARSVPLIVLGALLVNYGTVSFLPSPVPWTFGATLAFVLVAVVFKLIESRSGVGASRVSDYLVAAGFVFTATNIVQLGSLARHLLVVNSPNRLPGLGLIIVALALFGVALAGFDWLLILTSGVIGALGVFVYIADSGTEIDPSPGQQGWPYVFIAALGAVLVVVGIVCYRSERRAA